MGRLKIVIALAMPVVVMCLSMAASSRRSQPGPTSITVALPSEWIPFTAHKVQQSNKDAPRLQGMFYRRRDGSTAVSYDTELGTAVTIHNVQTRQTYVKYGNKGWQMYPMEATLPLRKRLVLSARDWSVSQESVAGFPVYERVAPNGAVARIAAGLNGLVISMQMPNGGKEEYDAIQIGDPPEEVFLPPPGAVVRQRTQPLGGNPRSGSSGSPSACPAGSR